MDNTLATTDDVPTADHPGSLLSWFRRKAAVEGWRLRRDCRTVFDRAGVIATCEHPADAELIMQACQDRLTAVTESAANDDGGHLPSPPVWARDALADGTEAERRLRDGQNRPIITLFANHPRSAYNEDFILVSRNVRLG